MIVLDASAAVEWLLQTPAGQRIENRIFSSGESLHAPHLFDIETSHVLRRLIRHGTVSAQRAEQAVFVLRNLTITRYAHVVLLPRIWQLRPNLSAYDAAYVVLAEALRAPLITHDGKLATAPGHAAIVEVF